MEFSQRLVQRGFVEFNQIPLQSLTDPEGVHGVQPKTGPEGVHGVQPNTSSVFD